ncbi:hypothetical protein FACHB389_32520 [Nostoc calcicola FACHB-389]|nr:hypothetical protein FACHB389_32520 [Nostoc calcicola FACHB-389]
MTFLEIDLSRRIQESEFRQFSNLLNRIQESAVRIQQCFLTEKADSAALASHQASRLLNSEF